MFDRRREKTRELPPRRRGAIDAIVAPRGSAKSTLISLVFPIHALLYRLDRYILLISATHRQAAARLADIRNVLTTGERLNDYFRDELADWEKRTQTSLVVNGVRIDAFSAGSELRGLTFDGWRPTWIVLDDVESSTRVLTSAYRDALAEWMGEVIENLGNGYTNIDLIGTLLHPDALPARLMERPDVCGRLYRSIEAEAEDAALWDAWRARLFDLADPDRVRRAREFFKKREAAMLRGARVLWPEKESYYDLQLMRATRGEASFNKEKQNEPLGDDATLFTPGRMRRFCLEDRRLLLDPPVEGQLHRPELRLDDLRVFGFLDPAVGESRREGRRRLGDFAAIVTVGVDAHGYLYALDAWLERAGPSAQIPKIFDLHERWNYAEFGVETNAFQKFLLEPLEAERERRRRLGRPWMAPVRGVRHRANKRMRILGLEPLVRNGWILFAEDLPKEFMNQLADFPHGRHDDGPDALQAAVALARSASAKIETAPIRRGRRSGRSRSF